MSDSKVVVEKHGEVTRVTIHEEGEWSLLMNDVDGVCETLRCFGAVSYCVYEDDDGFAYSMRPFEFVALSNSREKKGKSALVEI